MKISNNMRYRFIILGLLIIGLMTSTLFAYADEISQFILTKVSYPVIVNNQEYTSAELPVLNYQGNTYVPLKAVGKLLDAEVKWNDELKRVEIGDSSLLQNTETEKTQQSKELNMGEAFDNGNAKITLFDLKISPSNETILKMNPNATELITYKIKIELDENTIMKNTLWSGYYITDNDKYNTSEGRISILTTGRIDYGKTKIINMQQFNQNNYKLRKAVLSFPSLNIKNLVWKIAD